MEPIEITDEMIILDEEVEIKWHSFTTQYYKDLGYEYTGQGTKFIVKVEDLPSGSKQRVNVTCPDCKNNRTKMIYDISKSGTTYCSGCAVARSLTKDEREKRYGRLVVLEYVPMPNKKNAYWLCECDCGNTATVAGYLLRRGNTKSCGCYQIDVLKKNNHGENHWNWSPDLDRDKEIIADGMYPLPVNDDIIIIDDTVDTTWGPWNKKYYERLGYKYTGLGTPLTVAIDHVTHGINVKVLVECPDCGERRKMKIYSISKFESTRCRICASAIGKMIDESGNKYGRLTVVEYVPIRNKPTAHWRCICDCGNETVVSGSRLRSGGTKSCGCLAADLASERMSKNTGSKNPAWNPDLTDEERELERKCQTGYKQFIKDVYKRDGYICQICLNEENKDLNTHHLYSYSDYRGYRIDANNGITLCENCHKSFHDWMGSQWVKCTPRDFLEYLFKNLDWNKDRIIAIANDTNIYITGEL